MKKIITVLISFAIPVLLSTSAYAKASQPLVDGHFGYFTNHRSHGGVAGTNEYSSSNWSGYAVIGAPGAYRSVSSSWTQPLLNCAGATVPTYSAYWVGLDGFGTQTVEQIGTEGNCDNGQGSYYAWYEMYPNNPYEVSIGLAINPGDKISAAVNYTPASTTKVIQNHGRSRSTKTVTTPASYTLSINDATTRKSFATSLSPTVTYARSSAEVIAEAPYSGGILPLANYGTTSFSAAKVNGLPLGSQSNLQDIIMQNPAGMTSTPSAFDATNENFNVMWSGTTSN